MEDEEVYASRCKQTGDSEEPVILISRGTLFRRWQPKRGSVCSVDLHAHRSEVDRLKVVELDPVGLVKGLLSVRWHQLVD